MNLRRIRPALLSLGLVPVPLLAGGEVGVLFDRQMGKAQTVAAGQSLAAGNYGSVSPSGMGLRLGWSLLDLKVVELGLNATYHPKAEEDLALGGVKVGKFGTSYAAIGAGLDWKFLVNLHAGVEIRRERLTADLRTTGGGTLSGNVSQSRPWAVVGLGFSLPLPVLSPFIRLEFATPTTKNDRTGTPDDLREALAPQSQVGIYAGIRF